MDSQNLARAFERFLGQFEGRGRKKRFGIEMQRHVIDNFGAAERLRNHQPFVFGPGKFRFRDGFCGRLLPGLFQEALNMLAESAAVGRLQIVAIGRENLVKRVGSSENDFGDRRAIFFGKFGREDIF